MIRIIYIFLIAIIFTSCSNQIDANKLENGQRVKTESNYSGRIIIVGNEPFTKPAIMVNDSLVITLECDQKIENQLRTNQGSYFKVTGTKKIEEDGKLKLSITSAKKIRK